MYTMLLIDNPFFFQAEDGIRNRTVTGVQTCTLPISTISDAQTDQTQAHLGRISVYGIADRRNGRRTEKKPAAPNVRSEERRVGKGCGFGESVLYVREDVRVRTGVRCGKLSTCTGIYH